MWTTVLCFVLAFLSTGAIILLDDTGKCLGLTCGSRGQMDTNSCTCYCHHGYTGLLCDTELVPSAWPKGTYGLPATLNGCPESFVAHSWSVSHVNLTVLHVHELRPRHYWTDDIHILGPYSRQTIQLNFCSHNDREVHLNETTYVEDQSNNPTTDSDKRWPPGKYCIYKWADQCPEDFAEGNVTLLNYGIQRRKSGGYLPEWLRHVTDGDLTLVFCCRGDGDVDSPVELPANFTFSLFREASAMSCQEVEGMYVAEEIVSLLKESTDRWPSSNHLPYITDVEHFFNISFCYYWPFASECFDVIDKGSSYRGNYNTTWYEDTFHNCLPWKGKLQSRFLSDIEGNYCRRVQLFGWLKCAVRTGVKSTKWVPCQVPRCDNDTYADLTNLAYLKPVIAAKGRVSPYASHRTPQLLVNGYVGLLVSNRLTERVNFNSHVPTVEPYITIDLGFTHIIHHVIISRDTKRNEVLTFPIAWYRMYVWISNRPDDFFNFGSLACGRMYSPYVLDILMVRCGRLMAGRYVTVQNFVHSDPDVTEGENRMMSINEIEIYGKKTVCGRWVGMTSGEIKDSQISSSSYHGDPFTAKMARLHGPGIWCAHTLDEEPTLWVHLLVPMIVDGVHVQGHLLDNGTWLQPQSFKVLHGFTMATLQVYQEYGMEKEFHYPDGNVSIQESQEYVFDQHFMALIVGLQISGGDPCVKVEWIVCQNKTERNCDTGTAVGWESEWNAGLTSSSLEADADSSICSSCNSSTVCSMNDTCTTESVTPAPISAVDDGRIISTDTLQSQRLCIKEVSLHQCHFSMATEGFIHSPNYPGYYGDGFNCTWNIHLPDTVAITIHVMDVDLHVPENPEISDPTNIIKGLPSKCEDKIVIIRSDGKLKNLYIFGITQELYIQQQINTATDHLRIVLVSCLKWTFVNRRGFLFHISKSDAKAHLRIDGYKSEKQQEYLLITAPQYPFISRQEDYFRTKRFNILCGRGYYISLHLVHLRLKENKGNELMIHEQTQSPYSGKSKTHWIPSVSKSKPTYPIYNSFGIRIYVTIKLATYEDPDQSIVIVYKIKAYMEYTDEFKNKTDGWMTFDDRSYSLAQEYNDFKTKQSTCGSGGGRLAVLKNRELMSNAFYSFTGYGPILDYISIGLTRKAGEEMFYWLDGTRAIFQNWDYNFTHAKSVHPGSPQEFDMCVYMKTIGWRWVEKPCGLKTYSYIICERGNDTYTSLAGPLVPHTTTAEQLDSKPLFTCDNGELVDIATVCDGRPTCTDGSDEGSCETVSCGDRQFQCQNETSCVPVEQYCDHHDDCPDKSDETFCVWSMCAERDFQCSSNECIPATSKCDLIKDCLDGSDELNCHHTVKESAFKCFDNRTIIHRSKLCDGFGDCPGLENEDEMGCEALIVRPTCMEWFADGYSESGTYMVDFGMGEPYYVECHFDEDENQVSMVIHHIGEGRVVSRDSQKGPSQVFMYTEFISGFSEVRIRFLDYGISCSQQVTVYCSVAYTTGDAATNISATIWGMADRHCDLYKTCTDSNNRVICETNRCNCSKIQTHQQGSHSPAMFTDTFTFDKMGFLPLQGVIIQGASYPTTYMAVQTGPLVCNSTVLEKPKFLCNNMMAVDPSVRCLDNVPDHEGGLTGCRDATHLVGCVNFTCPDRYVKCPNSFCIAIEKVCDGVEHCEHGEDEAHCDKWNCPNNYRCKDSRKCIPLSKVCDMANDCPYHDDEHLCNRSCPDPCTCQALSVSCRGRGVNKSIMSQLTPDIRRLDLSRNVLSLTSDSAALFHFPYMLKVNLSMCGIEALYPGLFRRLFNLQFLDLSFNMFSSLPAHMFRGLSFLRHLNLLGNSNLATLYADCFKGLSLLPSLELQELSISTISSGSFRGLISLRTLNMSSNKISELSHVSFRYTRELAVLDLSNNAITKFSHTTFSLLSKLQYMYVDSLVACCLRPQGMAIDVCKYGEVSFSVCSDLLMNDFLRALVWIIAVCTIVGNILMVVVRFLFDQEIINNGYFIFLTNLNLSYLLIGVYLLIIACSDAVFANDYIVIEKEWRNGLTCRIAGILYNLGLESSICFLVCITVDRVKFVKLISGISRRVAVVVVAVVWCFCLFIALYPVLPFESISSQFDQPFYAFSSVCHTFPISPELVPGYEFSFIVFIVFNLICFLTIVIGQVKIHQWVRQTKDMLESQSCRLQFEEAKHLFMFGVVDCLSWCPVFLLGIYGLLGQSVGPVLYTWLATTILPLKGAVNSLLFIAYSKLSRMILERLGFRTAKFVSEAQVKEHLRVVHDLHQRDILVLHPQADLVSVKVYCQSGHKLGLLDVVAILVQVARALDILHGLDLCVRQFDEGDVLLKMNKDQMDGRKTVLRGLPRESSAMSEKKHNMVNYGSLLKWLLQKYTVQRMAKLKKASKK